MTKKLHTMVTFAERIGSTTQWVGDKIRRSKKQNKLTDVKFFDKDGNPVIVDLQFIGKKAIIIERGKAK